MTEPSIYDLTIELLKKYRHLVRAELKDRFKKTKPFRQEPVSAKEQLVEYDEFLEKESWLRQQFGDEAVGNYMAKMEKIRGRN